MDLSWFLAVLTVSGGLGEEICRRQPLAGFYEEIGCVPRKEKDSACPTSYDCSDHEKRNPDQCYFRGKAYAIGQNLEELSGNSCAAACKCLALGDKPSFNCAHVECPEHFGHRPEPNCRFVYEPTKCCASGTACGSTETTCSYQNQTYLLGQKFYPNDQPCKTCICMENFQGKLEEPFCSDAQCNTQLFSSAQINEGCVPIYYGDDGCCPIQWKCPEGLDSIRKAKSPKEEKVSQVCKFGSLVLQPGDELQHSEQNAFDCVCKLPPYLTCIMKRHS